MLLKSTLATLASSAVVMAANHDIKVGPQLTYTPAITTAAAGDTLTFHFTSNAHDVASGPSNTACRPAQNAFYSGLDVRGKTFVVTVNNTDPIYFYCTVPGHCQGGMVGGVNIQQASLDSYTQAARSSSSSAPAIVAGGILAAANTTTSSSTTSSLPAGTSPTTSSSTTPSQTPNAAGSLVRGETGSSALLIVNGIAMTLASAIFWAGLI